MNILRAPATFENDAHARQYILDCENGFRDQIVSLAGQLLEIPGLRLIGLTGPTCAGKTTAATLLIKHLEAAGRRVHMISVDDFFREQPHGRSLMGQPDGDSQLDFDSIDALDFDLFSNCLDQLMRSGRTVLPRYDLGAGRRKGWVELSAPGESDVILIEGIQVVYPEISALLHHYTYHSIYIDVGKELEVDGKVFSPNQIRLLRRLVRDYHFRSSEAEFTFFLWKSVRANEKKSIFPYAHLCESTLCSLMGYELGMLRPYLETILAQLSENSQYLSRAEIILNDISMLQPLKVQWLPDHALYREFVPIQGAR